MHVHKSEGFCYSEEIVGKMTVVIENSEMVNA